MATTYPSATRRHRPFATRDAAETRTETGISLARGPALILGTILLAAGLYFMYKAHSFPRFSNFPDGTARRDGSFFFGIFGANGWTGLFTAVCGGLLLFGAAQHHMAKLMSLIVGLALGAAAVIAVISGDVLGMAAANGWTELLWAVCAVILLFNSMIPRRRRRVEVVEDGAAAGAGGTAVAAHERPGTAVAGDSAATRTDMRAGEPMAQPGTRTEMRSGEPMAAERAPMAAEREPMAGGAAAPAAGEPAAGGADPLVTRVDRPGTRSVE